VFTLEPSADDIQVVKRRAVVFDWWQLFGLGISEKVLRGPKDRNHTGLIHDNAIRLRTYSIGVPDEAAVFVVKAIPDGVVNAAHILALPMNALS